MKKEYKKRETETTVVTEDNRCAPMPGMHYPFAAMIPGCTYRGSARIDAQGNFEFRPSHSNGVKKNNMRLLETGHLEGCDGFRWDVLGGPHSMKIALTMRDIDQLRLRPQLVTEVMHSLFVQAMCQLDRII